MECLFVYGTLAPGRPNEHVMQKISGEWLPARVKGTLIKAGWGFAQSGFPAMVPSEDGQDIEGYVFRSARLGEHWPALDEFEGADYVRVLTKATLPIATWWPRMCMRWRRGMRMALLRRSS
jgi:gamma-glutamylcyclotransferase (GGCT)/AIG2-like uncharacterized protein YtfP